MPLDLLEPRRRRPVRERPFRAGRSVRTLVRLNSSIVYHIPIRQEPSVYGTAPAVPRACSIREVYVCGKDGLEVYVCVYFARRQTRAML